MIYTTAVVHASSDDFYVGRGPGASNFNANVLDAMATGVAPQFFNSATGNPLVGFNTLVTSPLKQEVYETFLHFDLSSILPLPVGHILNTIYCHVNIATWTAAAVSGGTSPNLFLKSALNWTRSGTDSDYHGGNAYTGDTSTFLIDVLPADSFTYNNPTGQGEGNRLVSSILSGAGATAFNTMISNRRLDTFLVFNASPVLTTPLLAIYGDGHSLRPTVWFDVFAPDPPPTTTSWSVGSLALG